jgi:hypothetical protein
LRLEGLCQRKTSVTQSGIEQCLDQVGYRVPLNLCVQNYISDCLC